MRPHRQCDTEWPATCSVGRISEPCRHSVRIIQLVLVFVLLSQHTRAYPLFTNVRHRTIKSFLIECTNFYLIIIIFLPTVAHRCTFHFNAKSTENVQSTDKVYICNCRIFANFFAILGNNFFTVRALPRTTAPLSLLCRSNVESVSMKTLKQNDTVILMALKSAAILFNGWNTSNRIIQWSSRFAVK